MKNHTVTVCDFSQETCDSRMVMVCNFVIEAYQIQVAYKILLIFIGYYCLVFLWTVYVGVTLWWSITPVFFLMKTFIFSCEILQGASIFFKWNSFQQNLSNIYSFKILILTPFSLCSYASIFHVKIKFIMWTAMWINFSHIKYFWTLNAGHV